jgi:hypothetical protein
MKNPDREKISNLEELPNVGRAISADLVSIGICHPGELKGRDPLELYREVCEKSGQRQDPCLLDVFMSVISFMEGNDPLPWWAFTEDRKKKYQI